MKSWMILGSACLIFVTHVGCHREQQSPATSSTAADSTPATVEATPATDPPATSEISLPETDVSTSFPSDAAMESMAADLRQLADPATSPEDWESAQTRILDRRADAVPVLAAGLSSDDPLDREMAATLLAVIGDGLEQAEQPLRAALQDQSAYVRANAATALCQLPDTEEAVIPILAALLESSDPNLRQMAAINLGNFGPEAAPFVDSLAGSLEDDRPDVLMPVVELLGRIGPPAESAAPKLRQIAFEQTGEIQAAATAALEQIESGRVNVE